MDHILSVKDIIKYVKEEFDEEIEDRMVRRNIRVLIEKFGMNTEMQKIDENYFKVTLNVCSK